MKPIEGMTQKQMIAELIDRQRSLHDMLGKKQYCEYAEDIGSFKYAIENDIPELKKDIRSVKTNLSSINTEVKKLTNGDMEKMVVAAVKKSIPIQRSTGNGRRKADKEKMNKTELVGYILRLKAVQILLIVLVLLFAGYLYKTNPEYFEASKEILPTIEQKK